MDHLKNQKRRKLSSRTWLERQLNDPYVARAKSDGLRSRAAYKLTEIDDKYKVLKSGAKVVDLGAAPRSTTREPDLNTLYLSSISVSL